jgi:hypothetical protein
MKDAGNTVIVGGRNRDALARIAAGHSDIATIETGTSAPRLSADAGSDCRPAGREHDLRNGRRNRKHCQSPGAAPGGDALVVAPEAAAAGAKVVVRMPDWYPNFPYVWVSWSNWLSAVDTQVKAVLASGDSNISAFRAVERAGLDLEHQRRGLLRRRLGPYLQGGPLPGCERPDPGP